jgi:organic radical activating enzyme
MSDKPITLPIAEQFYSIQGEGRYMGTPSVFLRTASCNFLCGGFEAVEQHKGEEHEKQVRAMAENQGEEGATWVCDTIGEWMAGDEMGLDELLRTWEEKDFLRQLADGGHLVLTGGEPMLHQKNLTFLLEKLSEKCGGLFVEVETNGSLSPSDSFVRVVDQFNISPKLSNAGIRKEVRYNPDVLREFVESFCHQKREGTNADLKFVISQGQDWKEIQRDYLASFDIPRNNVYLMPAGADQEELLRNRKKVVEIAKKQGVHYSERLQIVIWDQATGV